MRLQYNILWFEDDSDFVDREIGPQIKEYLLEELGLEPVINHQRNSEKLDELVKQGEYDLVVTDLNLTEGDTGEKVIGHIRADKILTEVLLYSGDVDEINKIIRGTGGLLERVSFSVGRGDLPERLKRIIALTVRKVQDVNNLRGLVIAEAIDLEDKMLDIINNYFTVSRDDTEKEEFIKFHIDGATTRSAKRVAELSAFTAAKIFDFVDAACGEMFAKYLALNKLIAAAKKKLDAKKPDEKVKIEALDKIKTELEKMSAEVIDLRNDLAHVKEEKGADGNTVLKNKKQGGRETVFDNAKYVAIRKSLRSHAQNLAEIAKQLA